MRERGWVVLAVLLPFLGIAALVGRAELDRLSGATWHLPITGYDPRDLLHGRYLRYQFKLDWQGESTCGESGRLNEECCLCLTRSNAAGIDPPVRQVSCEEARSCDAWLRSSELVPPLRYFVPEDRALELETALRERAASLELSTTRDGRPAIQDLYLDGSPWREALAAKPVRAE